jgi:FixJ family two-component response regulator
MYNSQAAPVAVVDDHPSVCEALVNLLESVGHQAVGFLSAEEFLGSEVGSQAGCVITDIQMPGMSGFELVSAIREVRPRLPVIFITARREADLRDRARSVGVDMFYQKPLDENRLLESVAACVGMPN